MSAKSHWRGHRIEEINGIWLYSDTKERVENNKNRECEKCGLPPTKDDHDACIKNLPGVKNACCGHGVGSDSYIMFKNGIRIKGFVKTTK